MIFKSSWDDDGENRYLGYWDMTHNRCYNYCKDDYGNPNLYDGFYYGMEWKGECYCAYVARCCQ